MAVPKITPVSCPTCFGSALMAESDLLRLQHTILFHCPYCQSVASVTDATRSRDPHAGEGDEHLAA